MELDDLKAAWQVLDRRVERLDALELGRQRQSRLTGIQRSLRWLLLGQGLQLLTGVILCLIFAPYWVAHRAELQWLICGLALHGYGVLLIAFSIHTMLRLRQLDYGAPLLVIRQQMAQLARWKLSVEWPVFASLGCFIWIPLTLVLFGSIGADLWRHAPGVVAGFIASGFACLGLVIAGLRLIARAGRDPAANRWGQWLRDSALGGRIVRAERELAELAAFTRE